MASKSMPMFLVNLLIEGPLYLYRGVESPERHNTLPGCVHRITL